MPGDPGQGPGCAAGNIIGARRRAGRLSATVAKFVCDSNGNNSLEIQGQLFLRYLEADADPLIGAVAATEAALLSLMRDHNAPEREILWPQDPEPVSPSSFGRS